MMSTKRFSHRASVSRSKCIGHSLVELVGAFGILVGTAETGVDSQAEAIPTCIGSYGFVPIGGYVKLLVIRKMQVKF